MAVPMETVLRMGLTSDVACAAVEKAEGGASSDAENIFRHP